MNTNSNVFKKMCNKNDLKLSKCTWGVPSIFSNQIIAFKVDMPISILFWIPLYNVYNEDIHRFKILYIYFCSYDSIWQRNWLHYHYSKLCIPIIHDVNVIQAQRVEKSLFMIWPICCEILELFRTYGSFKLSHSFSSGFFSDLFLFSTSVVKTNNSCQRITWAKINRRLLLLRFWNNRFK